MTTKRKTTYLRTELILRLLGTLYDGSLVASTNSVTFSNLDNISPLSDILLMFNKIFFLAPVVISCLKKQILCQV